MNMISDLESKKKKLIKIAYCILCLLVCILLLTVDVIRCYNKYLSGEYQLEAEATIASLKNVNLINGVRGQDYLQPVTSGIEVGTKVYMHNIHDKKCDIIYRASGTIVYANDVPLEALSYNSEDYELLTGEKQYSFTEYMQRILNYTHEQLMYGFAGGALEYNISTFTPVYSVLLIFDIIYVIYKAVSKKLTGFGHFMNGLMYVSSSLCMIISILNINFA
jgi:hypothetical protein